MHNPVNRLFTFAIVLCLPLVMGAQALGYDQHRIAMSFDGNSEADRGHRRPGELPPWPIGDPDDWGAAPAAFAIIAKLGLQDQLVHCSYNNFIDAPAGPDAENQLKISCEGAKARWGFTQTALFDVTTHLAEARRHLANEMGKSTAEDPLYFIHAGLSEFLYQVVAEVIFEGHAEALNYVHIISHSAFNETNIRRPWHRTWADVAALAAGRLRYTKIQDQNDKHDPHHLWHSGKDFSVWDWMRDHGDPNIAWLYERLAVNAHGVADISDCGMVFYLLTGDDAGSPAKFKAFLGEGIQTP